MLLPKRKVDWKRIRASLDRRHKQQLAKNQSEEFNSVVSQDEITEEEKRWVEKVREFYYSKPEPICPSTESLESLFPLIESILSFSNRSEDVAVSSEKRVFYQRLVDVLASQVDEPEVSKQLRIQRRIDKSKNPKS